MRINEIKNNNNKVYHGTSSLEWFNDDTNEDEGFELYLTKSKKDALNYADEATISNLIDHDLDKPNDEIYPIFIEFNMTELKNCH